MDKQNEPYILVVDDEPNIIRLVYVNLEREGWRVEGARNGIAALAHICEEIPAVVITDDAMPEMDGRELIQTIRNNPLWEPIPIIFCLSQPVPEPTAVFYQWAPQGPDIYFSKHPTAL